MNNKKNYIGDLYVRSRSISEPEISFDKSAINASRFKPKHFPFEYIAVDDLHYYRRRKPYLFQSNLSLHSNKRCESLPHINNNGRTEYKREFTEKPLVGKLAALKRPPNLKVDAYPFLTGLYKSDSSLNCCNYQTEYDTNFPLRPFSPRIGMIRRPTNIKLNPGVMDIKSEQKSQFRAYSDDIFSSARPAMIKKPNNLHLTGKIELQPEYRSKFIPYSFDSVYKSNKPQCFHTKPRERREVDRTNHCKNREKENYRRESEDMQESRKIIDMRQNYESDMYQPEYKSKYKPVIGQRSSIIQQPCHFQKFNDEFNAVSEYNNRYKTYDQFTKSAPIKKQDNLYMRGETQMQPEYKDRYKEIDYKSYVRQPPLRQQDNLYSNERGPYQNVPEYAEQYKDYNAGQPERGRAREDYLQLNGDMEYDAEYRNNYVEFPRQRPIVRKPSTHIQLSSNDRKERKPDNFSLPIDVPPYHHDTTPAKVLASKNNDDDEIPIESTPEYRKAMRNYMLKERSPTRQPTEMELKLKEKEKNSKKVIDHNDVTKILTENKVNVPEEKFVDENNEVIVEKLKAPSNFKIPTRSPTKLSLGRGASYPIQQDNKFSEHTSTRTIRKTRQISYDDDDDTNEHKQHHSVEFVDFDDDRNNNTTAQYYQPPQMSLPEPQQRPRQKKSPNYGRRAPRPREDYIVRKNTNVIEGNSKYSSNFHPNRHERRSYHIDHANPLDFAPPSEPLANNYRPNYEIDKQQSYRESLNNNEPFVVLDREIANKVKQSSWMKKQWYDD
ncbi:hypothetical protein PVAND_003837 [Polypedilum vanderplanki]|uniref:Uncharacterized protein n=1 Tax=Polypedilum vanderplanki TaxID=319348 RepID=A0A9J6BV89_POLVA|nr:hypothetical protein PVAND_003837 [Polypedilum vanderplanki]